VGLDYLLSDKGSDLDQRLSAPGAHRSNWPEAGRRNSCGTATMPPRQELDWGQMENVPKSFVDRYPRGPLNAV